MIRTQLCATLALTALLAASSVAHAGAPAPTADAAYDQGKAALKAGDPIGALRAFKAGLKLAGEDEGTRWQLVLASALAYEKGGQLHHAIEYYQRFFEESEQHRDALSPKWKRRRTLVQGDMARLEKLIGRSHGYVTVATEPSGVQVLVDGARAGADGDANSPVGFYLPAGDHVISVRLAGHQLAEQSIALAAGKIRPLRFVLEPEPIPAPPDDTRAEAVDALSPPTEITADLTADLTATDGPGLGPWLVIGSAGALAIAAGAFAGLAAGATSDQEAYAKTLGGKPPTGAELAAIDQIWTDHEDTIAGHTLAAGALAGVAAATLAGGFIWLLVGGDDPDTPPPAAVSLLPTTGGLVGHASWEF